MSATTADSGTDDWRATLMALQQLHARLLMTAAELRVSLARPAATGRLSEAERVALYERVCADLQMLEALTDKLEQLPAMLEAAAALAGPVGEDEGA